MVRGYETMVIAHPEISEEEIQNLIDKINSVILKGNGESLKVENLGKRKLVYKVKGLLRGYFLLFYYRGGARILQEIDGMLRYHERVLRYQTVKLDPKISVELPGREGIHENLKNAAVDEGDDVAQEDQEENKVTQESPEELRR